eukprot:TRINITY_DN1691_c0_g1_i1.p1 TRINITY_DN1691_c0_g1~~TRINITY_DN1691_c0_g1_i1.p1  ORF type:complete len:269 (-),score=65.82 TRINITY_DN1691_c0_g1_i1:367-1173(-)
METDQVSNESPEEKQAREMHEKMIADGWISADMARPPPKRPPPPIPGEITAVPSIFNQLDRDVSHLWKNVEDDSTDFNIPEDAARIKWYGWDLGKKYWIRQVLNKGTVAVVRVGKHRKSHQTVAIKAYNESTNRWWTMRGWNTESELLPLLKSCPFIVSMVEAIQTRGVDFIVMEKCYRNVGDAVIESEIDVTEIIARSIIKQLLYAVQFIHDLNMMHGDIEPNNLMFSDESMENIKLIGFSQIQRVGFDGFVNERICNQLIYRGTPS